MKTEIAMRHALNISQLAITAVTLEGVCSHNIAGYIVISCQRSKRPKIACSEPKRIIFTFCITSKISHNQVFYIMKDRLPYFS